MKYFMFFCAGLGILGLLSKLFGFINTPWIWTLSPIWGFLALISLLGFLAVLGGLFTGMFAVLRRMHYKHQIQKRLDNLQAQEVWWLSRVGR